jgi:hypothetical protein
MLNRFGAFMHKGLYMMNAWGVPRSVVIFIMN